MITSYFKYNLYDFNHLREELDELYKIGTDINNYKRVIYRGGEYNRFVGAGIKDLDSFEEAKQYLNDIVEFHRENINDPAVTPYGQLCLNGGELEWNNYPIVYNWILDKTFELYEPQIIKKNRIHISKPLLTLYPIGGRLGVHRDGKPDGYENFPMQKPANMLLYLNKGYKKEWGGTFLVDGEELLPEFADLIFLNFNGDSDPEHCVTEVVADVNRFAFLFNIQYETMKLS